MSKPRKSSFKLAFNVDVEVRPDVIEAIRAQYPADHPIHAGTDLQIVRYYMQIRMAEAIVADERDLFKIAEIDANYIVSIMAM